MARYAYLLAFVILFLCLFLNIFLYDRKIKKAFREKSWQTLPKMIFCRDTIFGFVIPGSYYRDMMKLVVESGELFSESKAPLIEYCEQKGYGIDAAKPYLLLRELILQKNLPRTLLEEAKIPLNNALLLCARGDAGGFITEILTRPPENDNLRTLCAALAIKMGYINIPIDEKMRSSVYASLLTGGTEL